MRRLGHELLDWLWELKRSLPRSLWVSKNAGPGVGAQVFRETIDIAHC